jgi:predicted nucleotidyltransferase
MEKIDIIATLRKHEEDLRARGVRHAALFGSRARGNVSARSDIDILVEIDPDAHITIFDYVSLKDYITGLFDGPVDVVDREALKPHLREPSTRDAVYAF